MAKLEDGLVAGKAADKGGRGEGEDAIVAAALESGTSPGLRICRGEGRFSKFEAGEGHD